MSTPHRPPPHHPHAPTPDGRPQVVRTIGQGPPGEGEEEDQKGIRSAFARYGLLLSLILLAIGLVWTGTLLSQRGSAIDTSEWPNTLGMVLSCNEDVRVPGENRTETQVEYRYDVEGRRYSSDTVTFGPYRPFLCTDYPLGKAVRVYYAPWRPSLATLTKSGGDADLTSQLGGSLLCMLAGLLLGASQIAILFQPEWMRRPT
ncbi:MAG: DUF3592 domain-containing protein [Myxococcota bacterium]